MIHKNTYPLKNLTEKHTNPPVSKNKGIMYSIMSFLRLKYFHCKHIDYDSNADHIKCHLILASRNQCACYKMATLHLLVFANSHNRAGGFALSIKIEFEFSEKSNSFI